MGTRTVAPYGSWGSPVSPDLIVSEGLRVGQIILDRQDVYWSEMRPEEQGRYVVVRQTRDSTCDLVPPPFNARTRVHEYGGAAFLASQGTLFFSNFSDQRLYRLDPGAEPVPITPLSDRRYADGIFDPFRERIICIREDHSTSDPEPQNTLVSVDPSGSDRDRILVSGADFYSSPRLSPDGSHLAWLSWNHPNMPWDCTQLWLAPVLPDGSLSQPQLVAGNPEESIFQPEWSPDGMLHFVSDRSGWWNLHRCRDEKVEPLLVMDAEFGGPQWVFGMATYAFESPRRIVCSYARNGTWHLATLDTITTRLSPIDQPYTDISFVKASPDHAYFVAGSPTEAMCIIQLQLSSGQITVLRRSTTVSLDSSFLSSPEPIVFPTTGDERAHGFFYPPKNPHHTPPQGEKPPLLVISHGGPTSATSATLDLTTQFWTTRGIAVLDINYRGSSGYGRAYRQRLNGSWGTVDVDDCVNGALHVAQRGLVDENRMAIRGGSAGGYTTLAALTFRDVFKAGADYYGVSDLEALARDTHKFESRYLDRLVGPYPQERQTYLQRSPIHHIDQLSCPVIVFQGLEDRIVPPNQAEMIVSALRMNGVAVAYLPFEGEQHGFRQAANIKRSLEAELYFYSRVFRFPLADPIEPVPIDNLPLMS
jgi:dipeptidyl aminopeptidase/acylaminoacyl peptidase